MSRPDRNVTREDQEAAHQLERATERVLAIFEIVDDGLRGLIAKPGILVESRVELLRELVHHDAIAELEGVAARVGRLNAPDERDAELMEIRRQRSRMLGGAA